MGNLRACLAVAILALAACGSDHAKTDAGVTITDSAPDSKVFMDAPAPTFDFSCMGNAAPTTATAQITLSGTVTQVSVNGVTPSFMRLDGAALEACNATATACSGMDRYGTDTSANNGTWSIGPFNTSSAPIDAYVHMTEGTSRTVYVYPPSPFIADQADIPVLTFTPQALSLLGGLGCTQLAQNGMLGVAVVDCANAPITDSANIQITVNGAAATEVIDLGALSAQAAGTFLVCNVAPDASATVGATYNGMALRAHDVKVVADTTTTTMLRPGY